MQINGQTFMIEDYSITHNQNGIDTLKFNVSKKDSAYIACIYEGIVYDGKQYYRINTIDVNDYTANVSCVLNLLDWEKDILNFSLENTTVEQVKNNILNGFEWTEINSVYDTSIFQKTIEKYECKGKTRLVAISELLKKYNLFITFDTKHKNYSIIQPDIVQYTGNYISSQLNIISDEYIGDSQKLYTRVYGFGKDGLTIASINDGKDYIENFDYIDEIRSTCVNEASIDNANDLLQKMQETLNSSCKPTESYKFKIVNLSKLDDKDISLLDISVHKKVRFLDIDRKRVVMHSITKYVEYPNTPYKDEITIANNMISIIDEINLD